jgi:hypothetical protein
MKITSPRANKRYENHIKVIKERCKKLVPISKELIRKSFKDRKKHYHQFDKLNRDKDQSRFWDVNKKTNTRE